MSETAPKRIVLASDHAGFVMKSHLVSFLKSKGHEVLDVGTHSDERTDYPDHAHNAARAVLSGDADLGVLVCGSGNGVQMSANKHEGIRCGLAWTTEIAELARQHNDANMIALPARFIAEELASEIVEGFIGAEFEGGRHAQRVEKIALTNSETVK